MAERQEVAPPSPAFEPEARDHPDLPPREIWRAAVEAVREASPRHAKSLAFGRLIALRPGEVALSFPKDAAFHRATVTASGRALLEKTLSEHFGQPTRIVEEEGEAEPSLAEEEARDRKARERQAEAEVRAHPAVRSALRILGGEIEYVQVLEEKAPEEEPDERS